MDTLKNKAEFDFVYKNGRRHYGEYFNLYALSLTHPALQKKDFSFKEKKIFFHLSSSGKEFFLGLSVSKKIGNSPQRNKIKRRFRAFCRQYHHLFPKMILVFMAKDGIEKMQYAQMEQEILDFLPKVVGRRSA